MRINGSELKVDVPNAIRVYYRVLHIRMYNGKLVGIDLRSTKKECEGVLNGESDGRISDRVGKAET